MVRDTSSLIASLQSDDPITGFTHNFYRYPARFSPRFVAASLDHFTEPDDVVIDPFMGGGTTIVETVARGRFAIGIDINPLSVFVTRVKSTPLSDFDRHLISRWASRLDFSSPDDVARIDESDARAKNLPERALIILRRARESVTMLPLPRLQRFARCFLLALGQWALDGRTRLPESAEWQERANQQLRAMFNGLTELVEAAHSRGLRKNRIAGRRRLVLGDSTLVDQMQELETLKGRARLVLTSPPYPGVHMLYHRWQVNGRRETPAPYWLADLRDGHGASFYTFGSRTPTGLERYYSMQLQSFLALKSYLRSDALVVQLVSFANVQVQLPRYLETMREAGFDELTEEVGLPSPRIWRSVPNRKWYHRVRDEAPPTQEILLVHRPARSQSTT